ncbi:methyltransferase domain-containing protein, partial [Dehalococcoidia bacterium]|nr:methyltransferase domain-containing protein [Dehalococcoidia bacterium]
SLKSPIFHSDAANAERLLLGLHRDAGPIAQALAAMVDVGGVREMLDLGGGAGTYAIAFCERNPGLKATIFDLPNATRVARKVISDSGMDDRIQIRDGDFLVDSIYGTWGAVLMSNVLHGQASMENAELLGRVYEALEPGGRVIIRDVFMAEGLTSPTWGAVFSVNMLLHTVTGRCYSRDEIFEWLTLAGFAEINEIQPGEVAVAVKARS